MASVLSSGINLPPFLSSYFTYSPTSGLSEDYSSWNSNLQKWMLNSSAVLVAHILLLAYSLTYWPAALLIAPRGFKQHGRVSVWPVWAWP